MKKGADKKEVKVDYPYPSRFGSHTKMVDATKTEALNDAAMVVCKDEFGFYTTEKKRLDNGMADPHRYAESRMTVHS